MTYREQLNKVNNLGISICDLDVANELDAILDFDYTDDEFESLCAFGVRIYLKAEKHDGCRNCGMHKRYSQRRRQNGRRNSRNG